ncbi:MAG: sigma-70 family RNA polymerase sigma factor [Rikenellaceae bacterium]
MVHKSDRELLELFGQQDQRARAFELIVDKYSQRLYWTIRKLVVSHYDTDDILQNILIKLWQQLPTFRGQSALYTWLYRMAVNESLTLIRQRKRTERRFATQSDLENFENIIQSEGLYDGEQTELELQRAINKLPPKQKTIFVLRYWDEMPFKEIADHLGLSEGGVKSSYHVAKEKIEKEIKLSAI